MTREWRGSPSWPTPLSTISPPDEFLHGGECRHASGGGSRGAELSGKCVHERGKKANHGGFRERRADETPDGNYLEVVEEMLRRRENNGRDRDECTEALKNND